MDRIIECQDCGKNFILTESERNFYKSKNFPEPKRCKSCRKIRKNKRKELKTNG